MGIIKEVCTTAHLHGLPVTAHLEITNAKDAIDAGLDGIEHITSFGIVLLPARQAEKYKQLILSDNDARKRGWYEMWNSLKLENNVAADSLIQFLSYKKTFVCPTLAVFEMQPDQGDSIEVNGFRNMMKLVGQAKKGEFGLSLDLIAGSPMQKLVSLIFGKWNCCKMQDLVQWRSSWQQPWKMLASFVSMKDWEA